MWRLSLLLLASCSLVPTTASAAPPSGPTPATTAGRSGPPPKYADGTMADRDNPPIYLPISTEPADPWTGVQGDKPATFKDHETMKERWDTRDEKVACTAMRDHCLPSIAWFWIRPEEEPRSIKAGRVVGFTREGPVQPHGRRRTHDVGHHENPFVAYRTVPATRKNLAVGALAVAHEQPIPKDANVAFDLWTMGVVERIDWDLGMLWFAGSEDARFITSTRIAVLKYPQGGKVTILGGKKRDELAVKPADVILPDP